MRRVEYEEIESHVAVPRSVSLAGKTNELAAGLFDDRSRHRGTGSDNREYRRRRIVRHTRTKVVRLEERSQWLEWNGGFGEQKVSREVATDRRDGERTQQADNRIRRPGNPGEHLSHDDRAKDDRGQQVTRIVATGRGQINEQHERADQREHEHVVQSDVDVLTCALPDSNRQARTADRDEHCGNEQRRERRLSRW